MTSDEIGQIRNVGKKTTEEIADAILALRENPMEAVSAPIAEDSSDDDNALNDTMPEPVPVPVSDDRPIEILDLSVRAFNALNRAGIHTVQQLLDISSEDLLGIRNLGEKTVAELETIRCKYAPLPILKPKTEFSVEELKPLIMDAFVKPFKGLSFREIKEVLPEAAADDTIKRAVGTLLSEQKIEYVDYRCYMKYPSFYAFLDAKGGAFQDRELEIMKRRYSGETLESIAQDLGITRERVRQIQMKSVRKLRVWLSMAHENSVFDEDFYKTLYTKCNLSDSFWSQELGLSQNSICYLCNTFTRGTEKPENILNDEDIPVSLRYRVRSFLDREKIRIDGMLFPPRRAEIENYALQKFAQDELTFDRFIELYNGLLEANEIPFDEKLYYTENSIRSRANRFGDSKLCLWKQGERLRYYDIRSRDYSELLETLNLESYQNTELATLKLTDNYPALMEQYDIRDPYELHNLLKKIAKEYGMVDVRFARQPILQFGEFDRTKIIRDTMLALSPVTQQDLVEFLYLEFGYDRGTAIGYLTPLSEYYHNGVYDAGFKHIPDERIEPLKNALTEDFYYIDRIKEIYTSLFPNADLEEINPRSLKSLGFLVNSNYAVQNFSSAEAFFTHLLTREEVFDARDYISRLGSIQMFSQTYHVLLQKHRIFLFDRDQIITMKRLERLNVTAELIEGYCAAVQEFVEEESYFTIESLQQEGFAHELDALGFDDYFYASLLANDERFDWQRVFGTIVLYNGKVSGQISCADFILSQLREYESVDLDEFIQDVKDAYGVAIPNRYEVTNAVKGTELYYDSIMDKVYRDKSLYYADFDE